MNHLRIEGELKKATLPPQLEISPEMSVERYRKVYWLQAEKKIDHKVAGEVLFDSVIEDLYISDKTDEKAIEVRFRPGVTDNEGHAAAEALEIVLGFPVEVNSGMLYFCPRIPDKISSHLYNPLLQSVQEVPKGRFTKPDFVSAAAEADYTVEKFSLDRSLEWWKEQNRERCWAFYPEDLPAILAHFQSDSVIKKRKALGLGENITDVEIEVLAQTWSEHCKHRIFAADIEFDGEENEKISGLFKTYIKGTTDVVQKQRHLPWLLSLFHDNAGIVRFDPELDLAIKVETHNSPSALDPYGGALTGILGVNRDILGAGLGARPIANTNVLCFGPQNMDEEFLKTTLPTQLKHPREVLKGVHKGIEDGGNKSGIPTVNGAFHFAYGYTGKPLVYCGTIGVLPQRLKDGRVPAFKRVNPGDLIVMVGGRVGKDGIHGATFSSLQLEEGIPASVVQIGDPLTQKRVRDFLLEARDQGLFQAVTDNGAGGLSSSVGEMAEQSGGAYLCLDKIPLKYSGMKPYEMVISESQERMTFAVSKEQETEFLKLAKKMGVEATTIGNFNDSGRFEIFGNNSLLGCLDLEFLHGGAPILQLKAKYKEAQGKWDLWSESKRQFPKDVRKSSIVLKDVLKTMLQRPNITSKEDWVRQYDHEVQGATYTKPYQGSSQHGPSDAGVLWMEPHGGGSHNSIVLSCGLAPQYSHHDPYLMAQLAVDEAVRNAVASGADPEQLVAVDNFCWPDPLAKEDGEYKLGQLVRTCQGMADICESYGLPLVSGKDSMKNDVEGLNAKRDKIKVSVPPTLLMTVMGRNPDIKTTLTSNFKDGGDRVYLLGGHKTGLKGSEFASSYELEFEQKLPTISTDSLFKLYKKIYQSKFLFKSCHDVSEGGVLVSLLESCFGDLKGLKLDNTLLRFLESDREFVEFFFSQNPGQFVISVSPGEAQNFEKVFKEEGVYLGMVSNDQSLILGEENLDLKELLEAYQRPQKEWG